MLTFPSTFALLTIPSLLHLLPQSDAQSVSCPLPLPASCTNSTPITDTCCTNSPGGLLLQTQFWDTNPVTGPNNSWTIHGLWPDNCDGTYEQYCDPQREYTNITEILTAANQTELLGIMHELWVADEGTNEVFWEHEWGKHGTCISTLDPSCYNNYTAGEEVVDFANRTVALYQTLNTYEFLANASIFPSSSTNYTLESILTALSTARDGINATVQCTDAGVLDEVWYYFNMQGSVPTGVFIPVQPDGDKTSCPDSVMYLPKNNGTGGDGGGDGGDDEDTENSWQDNADGAEYAQHIDL